MTLPKRHPQYGGELTYYKDLEVGTEFYVCNGAWYGKVIEVDGVKKVYVNETKATHDITDTRHDWLNLVEPTKSNVTSGEEPEDTDVAKLFDDLYAYLNDLDIDHDIYSKIFDKVKELHEHFIG